MEVWAKPFLRWAGSKKKLLPELLANIPADYNRYVEPFAGSACLFFALCPEKALLADFNPELILTYQTIKAHPRIVARKVAEIPTRKTTYYKIRGQNSDDLSDIDRAVRFLYLNRNCFNGVYRTNLKGQFNVPMGTRTGDAPTEQHIFRCAYALRNSDIQCLDFESTLQKTKRGDFVYLDPPYASSGKKIQEYGQGTFDFDDLDRLFNALYKLDDNGIVFLLSYANIPEIPDFLRNNWSCENIYVNRHVGGFSERRKKVLEILVSNYSFPEEN